MTGGWRADDNTRSLDLPSHSLGTALGMTRCGEDYPKLALLNFWRKSGPSIFTMRHISWRRERMRSPMRSPRVSSRVAARAGDSVEDRETLAAGSSAKFVVMIVVRLSLYRVLRIRLTVSHTHSLGLTAPSSSSNSTSASNTGRSTWSSVALTESL